MSPSSRQQYKWRSDDARRRGLCHRCKRRPSKQGRQICTECAPRERVNKKLEREKFKAQVLAAYGGRCATASCEAPDDDLTIDHVDGRGAEHWSEHKLRNSLQFHRWLARNNFPDGFQVLCRSCNASKGRGQAAGPTVEPKRQLTLFGGDA